MRRRHEDARARSHLLSGHISYETHLDASSTGSCGRRRAGARWQCVRLNNLAQFDLNLVDDLDHHDDLDHDNHDDHDDDDPTTTTTSTTTSSTTTTVPAFAAAFTVTGNSASTPCQVNTGGGGIQLLCTFDGSASGPGTVTKWDYRFGGAGSTVKFTSTTAVFPNPVVSCGDSAINAVPNGSDFNITVFLTATPATGSPATTSKTVFFHRAGAC